MLSASTVYANALLVTLNSRKIVREVGLRKDDSSKSFKSFKSSFVIPLSRFSKAKTNTTTSTVIHIGGGLKNLPEESPNGTATRDLVRCEEGERFSNDSRV